jgi:hypothetical protein
MATKQLWYIATTPVSKRKPVMPRIYCKDGVSLSVQASSQHYAQTKENLGLTEGDDQGPWHTLEVGFLSGSEVPKFWHFIENHYTALDRHDHTGVDLDVKMPLISVYTVSVNVLGLFIEEHGGEIEDGKVVMPRDLHTEVMELRQKSAAKHVEVRRAEEKCRAIEKIADSEVFARMPVIGDAEAGRIYLEKYADKYDAAVRETRRLCEEWFALMGRDADLERAELAQLSRRIEIAGK